MSGLNKGDFVKCKYEGKEYSGCILEKNDKKGTFKVKICMSGKRAEAPLFEEVDVKIDNVRPVLEVV